MEPAKSSRIYYNLDDSKPLYLKGALFDALARGTFEIAGESASVAKAAKSMDPELSEYDLGDDKQDENCEGKEKEHNSSEEETEENRANSAPSRLVEHDQWDQIYLTVLDTQSTYKLYDLLSQNFNVVVPLEGQPLISQLVVLELVQRLISISHDLLPSDKTFEPTFLWPKRAIEALGKEDENISKLVLPALSEVQALVILMRKRLAAFQENESEKNAEELLSKLSDVAHQKFLLARGA
ncbi:hypothetical protein BKA70DRAFT_1248169 [Coprinopsis sp. MPI-PUGE-AT-0042]|nr:hypothetical protein BKA70DRAFT_1248169 [Coprinopsis sp. MPI-PUGE-AT-0042]